MRWRGLSSGTWPCVGIALHEQALEQLIGRVAGVRSRIRRSHDFLQYTLASINDSTPDTSAPILPTTSWIQGRLPGDRLAIDGYIVSRAEGHPQRAGRSSCRQ